MVQLTAYGTFEAYGDEDWFRVHLIAGHNYSIMTGEYEYLTILTPEGQPLEEPGYANVNAFTATETGDYFISIAGGGGSGPEPYSIALEDTGTRYPASPATPLTIAPGQSLALPSGGGGYGHTREWVAIDLTADTSYLLSASDDVDFLYIVDAAGHVLTPVASFTDPIHFTPMTGGRYYIGVMFGDPPTLTLQTVADDHGESAASAGRLTVGHAAAGRWETLGDRDWFAITLHKGMSYDLSLTDSANNGSTDVYDASGQLVKSGVGIFSATATGTYYISADRTSDSDGNANGSLSYRVEADLVSGDVPDNVLTVAAITVGNTASGTWEATHDNDWYRVALTAGQTYAFEMPQSDFSYSSGPQLHLYDASGKQIDSSGLLYESSGSSGHLAQVMTFTATASGTFFVGVDSGVNYQGSYFVQSRTVTDDFADNVSTTGVLTVGGSATGVTDYYDDVDWFAVQLDPGTYQVGDSAFGLYDAQGHALGNSTFGGTPLFTITQGGTYYVAASGQPGESYDASIDVSYDDYPSDATTTGRLYNYIYGTMSTDTLADTASDDFIVGGGGDDAILAGSGGTDVYFGGEGNDTLSFATAHAGWTADLSRSGVFAGGMLVATIYNVENLAGSRFRDVLTGDAGNNLLAGNNGNDTLSGGAGDDVLSGGVGYDRALYSDAASGVTIDLNITGAQSTGGAGIDTLTRIEAVNGSSFADMLTGDAHNNELRGGLGNDTLVGGGGNDQLNGGAGTDTADYSGAAVGVHIDLSVTAAQNTRVGSDTLTSIENLLGGAFNDILTGSSVANTLSGGDGIDKLDGGLGKDTLTGGAGTDRFFFTTTLGSTNIDTITDFTVGLDKIFIDHNVFAGLVAGNLTNAAFYAGAAAHDADDRIIYNSATGALLFDSDGTGGAAAVQFATLSTGLSLGASSFQVA